MFHARIEDNFRGINTLSYSETEKYRLSKFEKSFPDMLFLKLLQTSVLHIQLLYKQYFFCTDGSFHFEVLKGV